MPRTIQLLKQVRNAAATINSITDNPEYKALLTGADAALNELMLQDSSEFYLDYIARGKDLLSKGRDLLVTLGIVVPPPPASLRDDLTAEMRSDVLHAEIDRLNQCFVPIAELLEEDRSAEEKTFVRAISDWQATLYLHRLETPKSGEAVLPTPITATMLADYLRQKFPDWRDLEVTKFVSLDGGFSKKTILFETHDKLNGTQSMVIRAEQPVNLLAFEGSNVAKEFYGIKLMHREGLPIAEPIWLEEDRRYLGTRFLVSRKSSGKNYGGNLGANEAVSDEMIDSVFSVLADLHAIKLDPADPLVQASHFAEWLPYKTITETGHYQANDYIDGLISRSGVEISPQLVRGLKWLRANVPVCDEPPVIQHGDFAFNNLLFDQGKITAVLDWESSYPSDPALDIIWTQQSLSQFVSMPEFLARYERLTGRHVSAYRLAYGRVLRLVMNTIVCGTGLEAIDKYDATNINLCILGIKYPGYFTSQFNTLIEEAEKARSEEG